MEKKKDDTSKSRKESKSKSKSKSKKEADDKSSGSGKAEEKRKRTGQSQKDRTAADDSQRIEFDAEPGKLLIIRMFVKNKYPNPILVRVSVDDWVANDGAIYSTHNRIEPGYLYILQEGDAAATISLLVPEDINPGQTLKSNIRFPGANEDSYTILTKVKKSTGQDSVKVPEEKSVRVRIPFGKTDEKQKDDHKSSMAVYHLVSGLSNMSVLPSQWLFSECITLICVEGERLSKTKPGREKLNKIKRTRFYKNLTLSFATARFPQWISGNIISASSIHAAMGGKYGQGRIIYIWLKWLFSLVDTDIENSDNITANIDFPKENLEEAVARYGDQPQTWAGYLLLGLTSVSPELETIINHISENTPDDENKAGESKDDVDDVLNESGSITK